MKKWLEILFILALAAFAIWAAVKERHKPLGDDRYERNRWSAPTK